MIYGIENKDTGVELGHYEAETEQEALEAMAADFGYESYAEACRIAGYGNLKVYQSYSGIEVTISRHDEFWGDGLTEEECRQLAENFAEWLQEVFPGLIAWTGNDTVNSRVFADGLETGSYDDDGDWHPDERMEEIEKWAEDNWSLVELN